MSFSSFFFLIRFLPVALILYYLFPQKSRNVLLVTISLLFYAWGDPSSLPFLLMSAFIGYSGGLLSARLPKGRKAALAVSLLLIFGSLAFYKYLGFFAENLNHLFLERAGIPLTVPELSAPAGISFFSFTIAGYLIDIFKGESEPCYDPLDFLLFVCFFPKLLMGPIVRYRDMEEQIRNRVVRFDQIEPGAYRFACGLAKKVLLADTIAELWHEVTVLGFANISTPLAWLGVLAYSFQLYFDFSGYTDMALGLGLLFGFKLPENFRYPYSSTSATEFWRRWHITMGGWFKQYVYFPLGGSRCSRSRMIFNTFTVWALTGLWHGAAWNFILWGLFYFLLLTFEKNIYGEFLKRSSILGHLYTVFVTLIGWAIFAVSDMSQLKLLLIRMFSASGGYSATYYLRNYGILLLICSVLSTEWAGTRITKLSERTWFRCVATAVLLLLSLAYLTDATYQPFLYAQF